MLKKTCLTLPEEDIKFLKSKGINVSEFMRQAIQAQRIGQWSYSFERTWKRTENRPKSEIHTPG